MNIFPFEELIGKNISEVKAILDKDFENKLFGEDFYYTRSKNIEFYYGIPYNNISIQTDVNKNIRSISIYFQEILDVNFYNSFIIDYGKPDNIQVIDSLTVEQEYFNPNNHTQNLKIGKFKTKKGEFIENPIFIIWEKRDYQIKMFFRREQNNTEITFRLPTREL